MPTLLMSKHIIASGYRASNHFCPLLRPHPQHPPTPPFRFTHSVVIPGLPAPFFLLVMWAPGAQPGLQLLMLLPLPPKCDDCRCVLPHLALTRVFSQWWDMGWHIQHGWCSGEQALGNAAFLTVMLIVWGRGHELSLYRDLFLIPTDDSRSYASFSNFLICKSK